MVKEHYCSGKADELLDEEDEEFTALKLPHSPSRGELDENGLPAAGNEPRVPWFPYNFHAGNFWRTNEDGSDYCPQDATSGEMLDSGMTPVPTWVFSMKIPNPIDMFKKWATRQVNLFANRKRKICWFRIKNPGQGADWTVDNMENPTSQTYFLHGFI